MELPRDLENVYAWLVLGYLFVVYAVVLSAPFLARSERHAREQAVSDAVESAALDRR